MPRRELLTPAQRASVLSFPEDEAELLQYYTLTARDQAVIRRHRGAHNQLGLAVQLCCLRYPGRTLAAGEAPPPQLLGVVAAQLQLSPNLWTEYAHRDETRREHVGELHRLYGFQPFTREWHRPLALALDALADQTHQSLVLVRTLITWLRERQLILPPIGVIERLAAAVLTRAERRLYRRLTQDLNAVHTTALEALLDVSQGGAPSTLAWLRQAPGAPNPRNVLAHIKRLQAIRALDLPPGLGQSVHQNHLLRLAREGAQTAVYHLRDLRADRRYATLVAVLLETSATLTDETLALNDRLLGHLFRKAQRRFETAFQAAGPAINDKVRLYAQIGQALLQAKETHTDPFAAIEAIVPWAQFAQTVTEAQQLARDEDFDYLTLVSAGYASVRRYAPVLLETFAFKAAPAAQDIVAAIEALREWNREHRPGVPETAPRAFVPRRWHAYVFGPKGIDRRYYELCALSQLRNALRAGDIWVAGSRQFKDFEEYLMPPATFEPLWAQGHLPLAVTPDFDAFWHERHERLERELAQVNRLAERGELPDAEIRDGTLKVTPLTNAVPEAAEALNRAAYEMLPQLKITDLMLEVDQWTDLTQPFTHLKSGQPPKDRALLLTAILADAINMGPRKMAAACPGISYAQLTWMAAWHLRDETYSQALAQIVNRQQQQPLAAVWGPGTTSSSDGQRFRAGGPGEQAGQVKWKEVLRLATSIQQGTVTASLILRKLAAYPRQNSLATALRKLGRAERTLFTLELLQNPELRRRMHIGLNKGEAKNSLGRAVFFNRLGELRDRSFENQRYRASGLNLVVAAIILWNTVYLERAIQLLREKHGPIPEELLAHLSPLGWEHINLTGDYLWQANRRVARGHFRPLRQPHDRTREWFTPTQPPP